MRSSKLLCLSAFVLGWIQANADLVLYSSSFGGAGDADLHDTAVTTSGATGAQHTQYGTSASATWSAHTKFKADGSFEEAGTNNSPGGNNRNSATLVFTPQDGYIYNLTVTTSFTQLASAANAAFHAIGYFETSGYTGNINSATGAAAWALTRPGDPGFDNQVAHYNVDGGAGNKNAIPTTVQDTAAPSTLRVTLDTTGGEGNWAATYFVGDGSGGFTQLASVTDLDAVSIASVGVGVYNADGDAKFQSFELSVVASDTTAPAIVALSPNGVFGIHPGTSLVATFDKNIALAGGGSITIDDTAGANDIAIDVSNPAEASVSGNTLTINPPTNLASNTSFEAIIGPGTIRDAAIPTNSFPGTTTGQWTFSTATPPLRIMPMGDSITVGYTNADWTGGAFEFGYRSGLHSLLSNAGYQFVFVGNSTEPGTYRDPVTTDPAWPPSLNLADLGQDAHNGYAGKTASFLNAGISSWLASQDPNVILLKIGTNSQDQSGLQTLVNTITTTKPDCLLLIAQIMPKYSFQQGIVDYNTWIRDTLVPGQQALGRKVTVVDQYAPFLTNPGDLTTIDQSLFSNGINHPSNPGYDKMAQVWFDAIEALGLAPNTFPKWMSGFDGVGGQTGLNEDPDGDGILNGIENFFGTAPDTFSPGIAMGTVDSVQGTFTFTHPQGELAGDLAAAYRWSKDLQAFQGNLETDTGGTTVEFTTQADTPEPGTTSVTAEVTGTPCDRLFLRVEVTEN